MKIISILLALSGMTLYSTGIILQKKGSGWMGEKKKRNKKTYLMFLLWGAGMLLSYVISAIPTGFASKNLQPHVISALSGWGIVVTVFLTYFFLKEKLYISDIVYSSVIAACILLLSISQKTTNSYDIGKRFLYFLAFLPFLLLVPVLFKFTKNKYKTILLSTFSGIMSGLTLVFMNVLVKESGDSILSIMGSAYIYIYVLAGLASVAAMQIAYRLGDIMPIVLMQTSLSIVYPIVCSYLMFNSGISVAQVLLILIIAASCQGILRKR